MMSEIKGNIHSIESFGTVDGPGIRFVVFFQGCPMRCLYCHNPDAWDMAENKLYSASEIIEKYLSVKEFCKGGITATGGEPLVQIDFLTELFKVAKSYNIHTALDTSGIMFNKDDLEKFDNLVQYCDLVLLDIKHIDEKEHIKLTGHSNKNILDFAQYLSNKNVPVWLRHVVVDGITFDKAYLTRLAQFLSTLKNIKALDVIPYHDMAIPKYENMKIDYPLKDIQSLTKEKALEARNIILDNMQIMKASV